jgi:hypothetical protein
MGENARDEAQWLPNVIPILGVTFLWELRMFRASVKKENKHQIGHLGNHYKGFEA